VSPPGTVFGVRAHCPRTRARAGVLNLPRGNLDTPLFMPVGTLGTVKALTPGELETLGAGLILANAYHLHVRPGSETIARLGGLHRFMGWDRSILTDSGGYQVFSLRSRARVTDDGVTINDPATGELVELSPERVIEMEGLLGSDIMMPLDQPVPYGTSAARTVEATARSDHWAARACAERERRGLTAPGCLLFGIQQGGFSEELRAESARRVGELPFDGYAVGGLSFGEPPEVTRRLSRLSADALPEDRPRYLMGVGLPLDIVQAVADGIDMFDCVLPTRLARHGVAFVADVPVQLRHARWREEGAPLDPGCTCEACARYPAAYVAHLVRAKEILGCRLLTLHNVHQYLRLMERIRAAIVARTFSAFAEDIESRTAGAGDSPDREEEVSEWSPQAAN